MDIKANNVKCLNIISIPVLMMFDISVGPSKSQIASNATQKIAITCINGDGYYIFANRIFNLYIVIIWLIIYSTMMYSILGPTKSSVSTSRFRRQCNVILLFLRIRIRVRKSIKKSFHHAVVTLFLCSF